MWTYTDTPFPVIHLPPMRIPSPTSHTARYLFEVEGGRPLELRLHEMEGEDVVPLHGGCPSVEISHRHLEGYAIIIE